MLYMADITSDFATLGKAAGNCGSDLQRIMVEGTHLFPCVPGHEFSGEIVESGNKVGSFKIRDRVTVYPLIPCMRCEWCLEGEYNLCEDYDYLGSRSDGAFAEYVKVPASNLIKLPRQVDFEETALIDPTSCAINAAELSQIKVGDVVVVIGAGPVGCLNVEASRAFGAKKIILVQRSLSRLKEAEFTGADVYISPLKEDIVERVIQETGGRGADVVIVACGSGQAQEEALKMVARRGKCKFIWRPA